MTLHANTRNFIRIFVSPSYFSILKLSATTSENALMLASTIAEAGICGGKYNLICYSNNGNEKHSQWHKQSLADTVVMNISSQPMFPDVWSGDLPRGYQAMGRLCRFGHS